MGIKCNGGCGNTWTTTGFIAWLTGRFFSTLSQAENLHSKTDNALAEFANGKRVACPVGHTQQFAAN